MKYIQNALTVMVLLVFAYIIIGEFVMPANTPKNGNICSTLPGDEWYEIKADGSRAPFTVPGRTDGDITLETKLPDKLPKEVCALCFRGMDMQIYIGDELRQEYTVEDYRFFGDRSAECYVMASLYPEDAGRTLRVNYEYNSGMVYEVYMGTHIGILAFLFSSYGAELFVGIVILMLGLISLIASVGYRVVHHKYLEMQHLSLGVIIGSLWVLSNSIFRQLYTRNVSIMSDMPFLMVMLMPVPFLVFINSLQKGRYNRLITTVSVIEVADFVVCMTLFVSGKMTLIQSFPLAAGSALISIIAISATMILDARKKHLHSYRFIGAGFSFLAVAATFQIALYAFAHNGVFSGLFMAIGLFGFLIFAIIHTIKQIISIRLEANDAMHANKAKDDFLANMSHEIRTPLNGILGMDEMILRDTREPAIRKYAADIKSAGNTLLSLINDILDLSKIEAGSFQIIPVDYDVASVLNDVINMTRSKALEKDLDFSFKVAEDIPCILHGDEIRIRQVMLNIINNAIKYTGEGSVDVAVALGKRTEDTATLVINVRDSGVGIKEEDKEKLFESFQRLDELKNRHVEGTGLGLHITYRLVDMMGGRIAFDSTYGVGSVFTIYIPQIVVKEDPIGDFGKAVIRFMEDVEADETTLYAPTAHVLVVDDNEMNLEIMEGLLRDTGIRVDLAESGKDAVELVSDNTYDCILLDQMMPELNGAETLAKMKERGIIGATPVIALTADAIVGAREGYLAKGFTDYLAKPVKYEKLELMLKKFIPKDKQQERRETERELPVMLVWGNDSQKLRETKERLNGVYRCVCVVGTKAKERYLESHKPDGIIQIA